MRWRWVTLAVVVYVTLDLANPLMPGAVQLVGPSLETVYGCPSRSDDAQAPVRPAIPRHIELIAPERTRALPDLARRAPRFPILAALFRPPIEPSSAAPSPPSDDD
jgi:hypothetical protein